MFPLLDLLNSRKLTALSLVHLCGAQAKLAELFADGSKPIGNRCLHGISQLFRTRADRRNQRENPCRRQQPTGQPLPVCQVHESEASSPSSSLSSWTLAVCFPRCPVPSRVLQPFIESENQHQEENTDQKRHERAVVPHPPGTLEFRRTPDEQTARNHQQHPKSRPTIHDEVSVRRCELDPFNNCAAHSIFG